MDSYCYVSQIFDTLSVALGYLPLRFSIVRSPSIHPFELQHVPSILLIRLLNELHKVFILFSLSHFTDARL